MVEQNAQPLSLSFVQPCYVMFPLLSLMLHFGLPLRPQLSTLPLATGSTHLPLAASPVFDYHTHINVLFVLLQELSVCTKRGSIEYHNITPFLFFRVCVFFSFGRVVLQCFHLFKGIPPNSSSVNCSMISVSGSTSICADCLELSPRCCTSPSFVGSISSSFPRATSSFLLVSYGSGQCAAKLYLRFGA